MAIDRVHGVLEASTHLRAVPQDAARVQTGVSGDPALLWVGRLDANKSPLTVLAGVERAAEALPGLTLSMLYTDAPQLDAVRRRIEASTALRNRVRLIGAVPHADMAAWFSAADLFVSGSQEEAAGYAVIESCACGVTPVATDIAPFRAIAGAAGVGVLWTPGDAGACARALVDAAGALSEARRAHVQTHFRAHLSWPAAASQACAVYRELIATRTLPGTGKPA